MDASEEGAGGVRLVAYLVIVCHVTEELKELDVACMVLRVCDIKY